MSSEDRLKQLETLAADLLESMKELEESVKKLKKKVDQNRSTNNSNNSDILSDKDLWEEFEEEVKQNREKGEKKYKHLFEWMSELSASQTYFWETQANYYKRLQDLEDRQAILIEIIIRFLQRD